MKFRINTVACILLSAMTFVGCRKYVPIPTVPQNVPTPVPASEASHFHIDTTYYRKYLPAGSNSVTIPIVSGINVADLALQRAAVLCKFLMNTLPVNAVTELRNQEIYVAIFGNNEYPSVLPGWDLSLDATRYAGGFGPDFAFRVCGFHEGDISASVKFPGQYMLYREENVSLHEFSHALKNFAFEMEDSSFSYRVQNHFDSAIAAGLWANTYAATNSDEYWAEGAETYFNRNRTGPPGGDGVNNDISDRSALEKYDPGLFTFFEQIYHGQQLPDDY